MPDFNKVLSPGNVEAGVVNTVVEIPEGSILKIEWDRKHAAFVLDRVEPSIYAKPCTYGFIPQTLDEDGDELDTLIVCDEPIPTGVWIEVNVLGVMRFEDDGKKDHKIVVVPVDDRNTGDAIKSLHNLPEQWKKKIENHFNHYKDLKKPGTTKVLGWGGIDEAKTVIRESIERWEQ
jgi:inorganic pyrophosphatase